MIRTAVAVKPKLGRCKACKAQFPKRSMAHIACSPKCALSLAAAAREKKAKADYKVRKEAIKTRSDYIKSAQVAFNQYVRARDFGLPCASCGAMPAQKFGGTMDCSHYRSVGSAPHMRFHLHNAAAACVKCNRYLGGNVANLRIGLVKRIGLAKVEAVEADNETRKFSEEYLKRFAKVFTKKAKRTLKAKQ